MDDLALDKIAQVKFCFEDFKQDRLLLAGIELIKHVTSVALELCIHIVAAHATLDLLDFTHQVDHTVLEVQDYGELIIISFSFVD